MLKMCFGEDPLTKLTFEVAGARSLKQKQQKTCSFWVGAESKMISEKSGGCRWVADARIIAMARRWT